MDKMDGKTKDIVAENAGKLKEPRSNVVRNISKLWEMMSSSKSRIRLKVSQGSTFSSKGDYDE